MDYINEQPDNRETEMLQERTEMNMAQMASEAQEPECFSKSHSSPIKPKPPVWHKIIVAVFAVLLAAILVMQILILQAIKTDAGTNRAENVTREFGSDDTAQDTAPEGVTIPEAE